MSIASSKVDVYMSSSKLARVFPQRDNAFTFKQLERILNLSRVSAKELRALVKDSLDQCELR